MSDQRAPRGGLPVVTLALVACSVVLEFTPGAAARLGFERAAIARGEFWRLLSGHLVHDVPALAWLDLATLALFGAWVERAARRLLVCALLASALLASLAVYVCTHYERYVGSSALASGLLAAAAVHLLRAPRRGATQVVALALLALFAGKLALEFAGAWPGAFGGLPAGYEPAAAAHLGGALGGGAAALLLRSEGRSG